MKMAGVVLRAFPRRLCLPPTDNEPFTFTEAASKFGHRVSTLGRSSRRDEMKMMFLTVEDKKKKKKSNKGFSSSPSPPRPRRCCCCYCSSGEGSSEEEEYCCNQTKESDPAASDSSLEIEQVEMKMDKVGNNSRRIEARVAIEAPLDAVWVVLTDYERLADFIPGLAQSQVLLQSPNYARLFQVGEQKLALGLKFNAKGIIDCFEKELETLPGGTLKRDIDFQMVQGDFEVFRGKWSILQAVADDDRKEGTTTTTSTSLSYVVDVTPKLWLPVRLVEARLCNEIKLNLASICRQVLKVKSNYAQTNVELL